MIKKGIILAGGKGTNLSKPSDDTSLLLSPHLHPSPWRAASDAAVSRGRGPRPFRGTTLRTIHGTGLRWGVAMWRGARLRGQRER